jgi:hypothetical protein
VLFHRRILERANFKVIELLFMIANHQENKNLERTGCDDLERGQGKDKSALNLDIRERLQSILNQDYDQVRCSKEAPSQIIQVVDSFLFFIPREAH